MLIRESDTNSEFETPIVGSATTRKSSHKESVSDALSVFHTDAAMILPDDDFEGEKESRASDKALGSSYDLYGSAADLFEQARSCFMTDLRIVSKAALSVIRTGNGLEEFETTISRMNDLSKLIDKYGVVLGPKSRLKRDKSDSDIAKSLSALNEKANEIMGPNMARQHQIIGADRRPPLSQSGAPWSLGQ